MLPFWQECNMAETAQSLLAEPAEIKTTYN
jgi:hypothetical protein